MSLAKIYYEEYKKYFGKNIILDTGPLLFLLESIYNNSSIGKTPFTKGYSLKDFETLTNFLSNFKGVMITPQILAEVSNLINNRLSRNDFYDFMNKIVKNLLKYEEVYIKKEDILVKEDTKILGITDIGIFLSGEKTKHMILTKDLKLSDFCRSKGVAVIHFDELRFD